MKTYFIIFCLALGLMACNNGEVENLKLENQKLQSAIGKKNVSINTYIETLNEIADNLRTIETRENDISNLSKNESDWNLPVENQIFNDLYTLEQLIEDNKIKIRTLEFALEDNDIDVEEMNKYLSRLKMDLADRDRDLIQLRTKFKELDSSFTNLEDAYLLNLMEKEKLESALNTAWFTFGNTTELLDESVIHKTGGVLGIGSRKSLNPNINTDYYTKIDIRFFEGIPILSKKLEILSQHPEGSYHIAADDGKFIKKLVIDDPAAFWSLSKYLTLVID